MNEWIPLPEFPGYAATVDGRVMGRRGKELRPFCRGRNAAGVNLYVDGEMQQVTVKRIRRMVAKVAA